MVVLQLTLSTARRYTEFFQSTVSVQGAPTDLVPPTGFLHHLQETMHSALKHFRPKVRASRGEEKFHALYDRARTLERYDKQFQESASLRDDHNPSIINQNSCKGFY